MARRSLRPHLQAAHGRGGLQHHQLSCPEEVHLGRGQDGVERLVTGFGVEGSDMEWSPPIERVGQRAEVDGRAEEEV